VRRAAFATAAAVGGIAAALLLGEGVARVLGEPALAAVVRAATEARGPDSVAMAVDDGRVFAGRPGGGDDVALDRWGLRDPEPPVSAPCGLAILGDSVAWGHGLEPEQALGRRLEARLPVRVHTVAFPGWNTAQEAAALAVLGPELHPDAVLVLWVPNDAASLELDGDDAMYVQRRVRLLPGLPEEAQIALWRRSWLFRRVGDASGGEEVLLEAREHRAALASIAATSAELGVRAMIAQVPPLVRYPGWEAPWTPGRPVAAYAREGPWRAAVEAADAAKVPRFDLTAAIAPEDPQAFRLRPDDLVHPSAEAVDRFAEALAPWIGAELPARCRADAAE
jgi:lysophospholipase L1-like esterase